MAVGQVVIVKQVPWQGGSEEFSNVYNLDDLANTAEAGQAAAESILALERAVHAPTVNFKELRVYTFQGLAGYEGIYRADINLAGLNASAGGSMYRECAILVKFELPRSGIGGFGRFRQLMKWLHVGGMISGDAQITGATALTATQKTFYTTNYADPLRNNLHGGARLSNGDGVRPSAARIHDYVEHRQFHQGRKES